MYDSEVKYSVPIRCYSATDIIDLLSLQSNWTFLSHEILLQHYKKLLRHYRKFENFQAHLSERMGVVYMSVYRTST